MKSRETFRLLAGLEGLLVILGSAVWFYVGTAAYLAAPTDGDLYAHHWRFQLMVFCLFKLPIVALLLGLVLAVEYRLMKPRA
jgi:hypothetical protein